MVVRSVFQLVSGLGLFIGGMKTVKDSFYKPVNDKLQPFLSLLTVNLPVGMITGVLVTILIQSSSATTVLIISLVQAGLLSFRQAQGVIIGANIGTTITVQLFSFKLEKYVWVIFLIGLIFYSIYYFIRLSWVQYIAQGIIGFGILFLGLDLLGGLVDQWRQAKSFRLLLSNLSTIPSLGIIGGSLLTAIIQSSSALTGIVVVLAKEKLISLLGAVALALGSNVGTCITAFIAGVGANQAAKNLAWFHLIFNLGGVIIVFPILPQFVALVSLTAEELARQVANAHTIFNIINSILLLSISSQLNRFLQGGDKWS